MEKKILVAYTTYSGSTAEVAQAIAQELGQGGVAVEVSRAEAVTDVAPYAAVVVGGPMILGVHGELLKFLRRHRPALSQRPVACFLTAMSLTQTDETALGGVPLCLDRELAKPPQTPGRLSFKERYATPANYVTPLLKQVQPASVALFGGKLEYFKLNVPALLFVMLIIQARPGDYRNWDAIRAWAAGLRPALLGA